MPEEFDASDEDQVRSKKRDAKRIERERRDFLRMHILGTKQGRDWLYGHLEQCHVFSTSFSIEPGRMAFAEGERNIGLRLYEAIMAADPRNYLTMLEEHDPNAA